MLVACTIVAIGLLTLALARALGLFRVEGFLAPLALFLLIELLMTWPSLILRSADEPGLAPRLLLGALAVIPLILGYGLVRSHGGQRREVSATPVLSSTDRVQLLGLLAMAAVISLLLYRGIPPVWRTVTELGISDSSRAALSAQRKLLTKGAYFGTSAYRGQGLLSVLQLCTWVLIGARLGLLERGVMHRSTVFLVLLTGSLLVGGVGERASVVLVVAAYLLARMASSDVTISRGMVRAAPVLLVVLVAVGSFSGQAIGLASPADFGGRLASRLFLGNGTNTVDIIELRSSGALSPGKGSVLAEQALAALPGVAPGKVPFSNRLARAQGAVSATTYSSPTNLGLMYADWGWPTVWGMYLAIGLSLAVLERRLRRARASGFAAACAAAVALWAGYMSLTGPIGAAVNIATTYALFGVTRAAARQIARDRSPRLRVAH